MPDYTMCCDANQGDLRREGRSFWRNEMRRLRDQTIAGGLTPQQRARWVSMIYDGLCDSGLTVSEIEADIENYLHRSD